MIQWTHSNCSVKRLEFKLQCKSLLMLNVFIVRMTSLLSQILPLNNFALSTACNDH